MKPLSLTVYEPGDTITTATATGDLCFWIVQEDGVLAKPAYGPLADPPPAPISADSPIEDLNLTVRTYNLLKREEIVTYRDLVEWWTRMQREGQIDLASGSSEIRNFGTGSINEVVDLLQHGPKARP